MRSEKRKRQATKQKSIKHPTMFGKPYGDKEKYYEKYSYKDVLEEVQKHISNNEYTWKCSAACLPIFPNDEKAQMSFLKILIRDCPDLFKHDNLNAKKFVSLFGDIIWRYHHGRTAQIRKKAEDTLKDLIFGRVDTKGAKKNYIPPLLSLKQLYDYLHKITEHLKEKYKLMYDVYDDFDEAAIRENMNELKRTDIRLYQIAKDGHIKLLLKKPGELTRMVLGKFFGCTAKGIEQKIKCDPYPSDFNEPLYCVERRILSVSDTTP